MSEEELPVVENSHYDHENYGQVLVLYYTDEAVKFGKEDGEEVVQATSDFIELTEPADLSITVTSEDLTEQEPEL